MRRLLLLVPTKTYRAGAFVAAAQHFDVAVTLASEEPSSLAEYLPADLISLDFTRADACAKAIRSFAREHPIDAVIGVDDGATLAASVVGEALRLPHNSFDATYATLNKHTMRERLARGGVPVPEFRRVPLDEPADAIAASLSYPCVVKPLMMAASRGVIRVDSAREFAAALPRLRELVRSPDAPDDPEARDHILVEQYVQGWEVAVEGILTGGVLDVLTIFDKPDPLEGPYFPETIYTTPSSLPAAIQNRIADVTQEAVRAIGLEHGPVHAELRGTDDALWFIEVAARSIGGYCSRVLHFEEGRSLEDVIIAHALDPGAPLPRLNEHAAGVLMMQAATEGTLREARGLDRARAIDGIDEVILSAHLGQELKPLPEGFLYIGFAFARGDSAGQVAEVLRAAQNEIEFVLE